LAFATSEREETEDFNDSSTKKSAELEVAYTAANALLFQMYSELNTAYEPIDALYQ
jgi:hypothetical protein